MRELIARDLADAGVAAMQARTVAIATNFMTSPSVAGAQLINPGRRLVMPAREQLRGGGSQGFRERGHKAASN